MHFLSKAFGMMWKRPLVSFRFASCVPFVALCVLSGLIVGCSGGGGKKNPFAGVGSPIYPGKGPLPKGGGREVVGKPYVVGGQRYYPRADSSYDRVGVASWYGPKFHRRMTSNGEWFDMHYPTAAHPTLPLPSYAKVTNMRNGRSLIVRINDRGPFVANREIDLSKKSAELLGYHGKGLTKVRVQYIGPAPLNDKGSHLTAMNEELRRGTPLRTMIASAGRRSSGRSSTRIAAVESPRSVAPSRAVPVYSPPSGSGYFIQVGAFSKSENAYRLENTLAGLGPVFISPLDRVTGRLYRVQVGPLASAQEAQSVLGAVVARGHRDAQLVLASK